ncbi:siderophore synthetase [Leucobacter sp. UCD-THU]|uniref:Siderophore-interacting protein n=1 Tax=Leucobacter muris TaxID=1935379 RepID=A0ABX5QHT0_9MICO|nr:MULTISPECIES: siderophore-interacting protein [Leucobacter]EYT55489.1 siderophore synthetase [Leucobacter sp. UCD-THU]QAB18647.1 siderophore-interacting protein [Leucobacter muris]
MTSQTPLHRSAAIQSDDHNRGLVLGTATVHELHDISAHLVRVVLRIPDLAAEPLWERPNTALRFYLEDRFEAASRVYTVRSADPAAGTVEVDVVRHGAASPMMRWLEALQIGDAVQFGGPRPHFTIPDVDGREALIFADATSLPALYAILQQADESLTGRGWIATDDETAFAELPQLPGLPLSRIRPGVGFGSQLATVADPSAAVVWGAGERDEMREVRRFFRTGAGLAKEDVAVFGYWKRGTTNTQIDAERLAAYEKVLASGGTVTELDDLALPI